MEKNQEIRLFNRKELTVTGVLHVAHFDATQVVLETNLGVLVLEGEGLNIKHFNLEQGEVQVEGKFKNFLYPEEEKTGVYLGKGRASGIWKRLWR